MLITIIIICVISGFLNSRSFEDMDIDYKELRGFKPLSYVGLLIALFLFYLVVELTPLHIIYYHINKIYKLLQVYRLVVCTNKREAISYINFLQICEAKEPRAGFYLWLSIIVTKKVLKRSGYYQEYEAINPEIYLTLEGKRYEDLTKESRMQFDKDYITFVDSIKCKNG